MNDGGAQWIQIVTRIFDDPKIILISELEAGTGILVCWFRLLCLAGLQNQGGAIYFTESIPFTPEHLAAMWRCKPALVQEALASFQRLGMISIDNTDGTISILNWCKYQNEAGLAQIRERSLKQLQDRSPESVEERRARKRERDAERQRRCRQSHKKNGLNGVVTPVTLLSRVTGCDRRDRVRDRGVTPALQTDDSHRDTVDTVTPQNKIENKNKNKNKNVQEPPTVPQGGTSVNDFSATKEWLNKLFGRKRAWSCEEDQLLAGLLPISREDRELLSWAYTLRRDSEGWALIDRERASKPKQSLVTLLREFSSEIDKWRSARANHNQASESPLATGAATEEWTPERRAAFEKLVPGSSDPGPFYLLERRLRKQIGEKVKEERDRLTPEWASMMEKLYGAGAPIPPLKSHLAPSVRDEIEAALKEEAAMREQAKKSGA